MWLFFLFVAVPIIEIALFIQIGDLIGLFPTLLIVIATAALGTWLVRGQGLATLSTLRNQVDTFQNPTQQLAHGAMILFAGALLLTPGFFTDGFGFLLLVPRFRDFAFDYLRTRISVYGFCNSKIRLVCEFYPCAQVFIRQWPPVASLDPEAPYLLKTSRCLFAV